MVRDGGHGRAGGGVIVVRRSVAVMWEVSSWLVVLCCRECFPLLQGAALKYMVEGSHDFKKCALYPTSHFLGVFCLFSTFFYQREWTAETREVNFDIYPSEQHCLFLFRNFFRTSTLCASEQCHSQKWTTSDDQTHCKVFHWYSEPQRSFIVEPSKKTKWASKHIYLFFIFIDTHTHNIHTKSTLSAIEDYPAQGAMVNCMSQLREPPMHPK